MKKLIWFIAVGILFICSSQAQVKRVDAVGIVVRDMERSVKFYTDVLGFKKTADIELDGVTWEKLYGIFGMHIRRVRMQLGEENIELIDYLTTGGRSIPEDFKSNDLAFQHIAIVVSDMESAYRILRKHNIVHVSSAPQTLPPSIPEAAGIKAFYFQDPDRHNLELIYFPKGKGQEKWQRQTKHIFLGIDHTAFAISNTEVSHRFYSNLLGFDWKGDSWNKGIEQERLNNVEGASLHISGYRAHNGPGVEFLQYLAPGAGKKYPSDTRSDDLWNWLTIIQVDNAEKLYNICRNVNTYGIVSRELVAIMKNDRIVEKGFIIRDPDGHAVYISEILN
jgi:catechol 2,3-dioxygenase-like lactoylglutathione lyase family enzyme